MPTETFLAPPRAAPPRSSDPAVLRTVTEVNLGSVMATVKVKLDGGEQLVTASVTKEAAEDLGLSVGAAVTVLVKSTEVMLGVE